MYSLKKILCGVSLATIFFIHACAGNTPKEIVSEAGDLREKGDTVNALDLYNKALILYLKEKNYQGMLDCLIGRFLVWQHLYRLEDERVYAIMANQEAETMVRVAKDKNISNRIGEITYFSAKACLLLEDYLCAERDFKIAADSLQPQDAWKGDVLSHLGFASYMNGHKAEGKAIMLQSVDEILNHHQGLSSAEVNTMLSGAYLRLAKSLVFEHPIEALEYFARAEKIILNDPSLVLRRKEIQVFQRKLKSLSFKSDVY